MTYADIASCLGMRYESMCRGLAELCHRGLIEYRGKARCHPRPGGVARDVAALSVL